MKLNFWLNPVTIPTEDLHNALCDVSIHINRELVNGEAKWTVDDNAHSTLGLALLDAIDAKASGRYGSGERSPIILGWWPLSADEKECYSFVNLSIDDFTPGCHYEGIEHFVNFGRDRLPWTVRHDADLVIVR